MPVSDPLANAVAPDTSFVVCLRPFDATGHELVRGEVISTEGWPGHRISTLIERRYIAPLPAHLSVPEMTRVEGVNRRVIDLGALAEFAPVRREARPTPKRSTRKTTQKKQATKSND